MRRMASAFALQGRDGILLARTVEDRLYVDTWQKDGYNLLPRLRSLAIPTHVIAGEDDFIPIEVAEHIAQAVPRAQMVTIRDCGHFAYLECPTEVRAALNDFSKRGGASRAPS